jgi:hypothetical protein
MNETGSERWRLKWSVARMTNAPAPWEGTSCADDMRLLHERIENRFLFCLIRIWFRKSDTINIRSILGAIEEDGVMVRL